ncbi:hypothetical protein L2E82_16677 [Cichorium intybus]|uniref:Uncharacterized protein n=1 Tax=Cichorium intybus TaxID=13427 RepID=A0ACB9F668_CICIN|nr:hypothetical protein L2E82_16677 [Cichorium intybus]
MVAHDKDAMDKLIEMLKDIRISIRNNPPPKDKRTRSEVMDSAIGVSRPDEITIRNPENIRNKGGGTGKRLKGKREIALKNMEKDPRTCTFCLKKIPPNEKHDRRNCPERKKMEKNKEK